MIYIYIIIGIVLLMGLLIRWEIKKARYFDEETNRYIPKSKEKEYLKNNKL
jgi:hypothetical protein